MDVGAPRKVKSPTGRTPRMVWRREWDWVPPDFRNHSKMEKSFYPSVIADTFRIAAMKFDGG